MFKLKVGLWVWSNGKRFKVEVQSFSQGKGLRKITPGELKEILKKLGGDARV